MFLKVLFAPITHQPPSDRMFMHPDPESMLQQASPVPRCPTTPLAPGLCFCGSRERKLFELPSLGLRSSSVGAYGGGASIVGGGEVGGIAFVMSGGLWTM